MEKKDLEKAEKEADDKQKKLTEILIEKKYLEEEKLVKLQAYVLGIPFVNLEKEKIADDVLRIIPEPIAKEHKIVAYRKRDRELEVAMLDPEDLQTIDFIKKTSNLKILPRLTTVGGIDSAVKQYQRSLEAEFGELIKEEIGGIAAVPEAGEETSGEELQKAAAEMPVIKIVDTLIKHAILQSSSDIHIEPLEKELIVRFRVDGILRNAMILPKGIAPAIVARIKVLSSLKLDEHRLPQDGRFKIESDSQKISFRVSVLPVFDGEKIVMRILHEDSHGYTLESLGLTGEALEIVHRQIQRPHGMILVTGPTGSGKTTTLYAVMDILNTPEVNISTIEDPIEYRMPRINQTQVKSEIGLTFANGLRSLLRQDPDIIMVGEIRDNETAGMAINSALTGHLVLSTLHTNTAAGALPRLLDMKIESFLIASTVNVIVAQRLVRRLHPETRQIYRLSANELAGLRKEVDMDRILDVLRREKIISPKNNWEDIDFYRPASSEEAPDGYKGRVGIFEVLEITENIRNLVTKGATMDEIEDAAVKEGMIKMLEDGFAKAIRGETSVEEVLRTTKD